MIVGLFLNNYKCYKKLNFIPLSYGEPFCGLIGKNGVGKSAVLEALDCVFNERENWNVHYSCKKGGQRLKSQIIPLFLLPKKEYLDIASMMETFSQTTWDIDQSITEIKNIDCFYNFKTRLKRDFEDHYLIAIGMERDYSGKIQLSSGFIKKIPAVNLEQIWHKIKEKMEYIYIPKDIDPSKMTLLQTEELQLALGQRLENVISSILQKDEIKNISKELKKFTGEISEKLDGYEFKESFRDRQSNLKPESIYKLIIKDFFSSRRLNKIVNNNSIDVGNLSSGEKQQAIIELYSKVIKELRKSTKKIVLGIDEPESSLHISACFDQFERLHNLSCYNAQLFFTAHWYGFVPTLKTGTITNITYDAEYQEHAFYLLDAYDYLEKGCRNNELEFELKSINDFVQSVVSGISKDNAYNWLICEGSSDKIYFEHYLSNLVARKNLRIVVVSGVTVLKSIYELLKAIYNNTPKASGKVNGKILLLADTDENLLIKDVAIDQKLKFIHFKRLCTQDEDITFVDVNQPNVSSADIESGMNGKIMFEVLKTFQSEGFTELDFVNRYEASDACVKFAIDWPQSAMKSFKSFLDGNGIKVKVAQRYVDILQKNTTVPVPSWITSLSKYW